MNGDGKETRLCPFKKKQEKSYDDGSGFTTTRELLEHCVGTRCMAYRRTPDTEGRCLLVEMPPRSDD